MPPDSHPRPPSDEDPFAFAPDDRDAGGAGPPTTAPIEPERTARVRNPTPADADADADADRDTSADPNPEASGDGSHLRSAGASDRGRTAHSSRGTLLRGVRSLSVPWIAGVVVVFVAPLLLLSRIHSDDSVADAQAGDALPAFAAPLSSRPRLEFDAVNLATRTGEGRTGKVPACSVRSPSAVTSCALLARGPLALVLYRHDGPRCQASVDALDAERRTVPGIQALAVALHGTHDDTRATARARRWTLPVAYDRDGWLGRRFGSPECAALVLVGRDGVILRRTDGHERGALLRRELAALGDAPPRAAGR